MLALLRKDRLRYLGELALDLLFPPRCLGCGRGGGFLCPSCYQALPFMPIPYCRGCGEPLPQGELCPRCRQAPLEIDGIRAPFLFEGGMRQAVHAFKYEGVKAAAPALAGLLKEYLNRHPLPTEVLVPVPLHPRRLRERGYNQAALLARELGRHLGLPVLEGALKRGRDTPPQVKAAALAERRANVAGAFLCPRPDLFKGKKVLLLDDVSTTGATLEACSQVLKAAGAASVWGLALTKERRKGGL